MAPPRSKHTYHQRVNGFLNNVLIVCPSCGRQALVKAPIVAAAGLNQQEIKVVCTSCGFNRQQEKPGAVLVSSSPIKITGNYAIVGGAIDPYFHLPLWLTANCCNNTLWAYNYEHLDFLKEHVEARLRERNTHEMANGSLGSRLPRWMTSTKNRQAVLKAIEQLKLKA